MSCIKTAPDTYRSGRWLQRYYVNDKYTWSVSGVLWNNIKERCRYMGSTQSLEPTYIGTENHFKCFSEFVEWNKSQVGYAMGYDIDADILRSGDKCYSKDNCLLIPPALNRFIQGRDKIPHKELPRGMCFNRGKIWVRLTIIDDITGKRLELVDKKLHLDDIEKAKQAYQDALLKSVDIWIDRLLFSGRYCVDERVVDYLNGLRYKVKHEGFTW